MGAGSERGGAGKTLRGSVALREEVQAAARLGISYSEFMGWSERDRGLMLALGRVERNTGRYGEWLPDATSDKASLNYYGEDRIRYEVVGPFTNVVEKLALDTADAARKNGGENVNLNGVFWGVQPA